MFKYILQNDDILSNVFGYKLFNENHELGDVYLREGKNAGFTSIPCFPKSKNSIVVHHYTENELFDLFKNTPFKIIELKPLKDIISKYEYPILGSEKGFGFLLVVKKEV